MATLSIHKDSMAHYAAGFRSDSSSGAIRRLDQSRLGKLYRENWLAKNSVDMYAEDMTALGVDWITSPEIAKFIEGQFRKYRIWSLLTDAIRWARLYGGSIICVDMVDGQPSIPINRNGEIAGFRVFDRYEITPDTQNLLQGENAGLPSNYIVSPNIYQKSFTLDASRAIRFVGTPLPHDQAVGEDLWGDSVVQSLSVVLDRYENGMQSSEELLKRSYLRFLGIRDFWKSMSTGSPEVAQSISKAIETINQVQNISGITAADSEDKFETQQYSFGGIKDVLNAFAQDVSGATGVPLVRLFGMSPSGFATGEADLKNYYMSIKRAQEAMLREPIERLAKLFLVSAGYSEEVDFQFISHNEPSEMEKIQSTQAAVSMILQVHEAGLINAERALEEISRLSDNSGGIFSSITPDDVKQVADDPIPLPDILGGEDGPI